jgi:hypothetical protein
MGLTFVFRNNIDNIGIVLGGGGVVLGGILKLMGNAKHVNSCVSVCIEPVYN